MRGLFALATVALLSGCAFYLENTKPASAGNRTPPASLRVCAYSSDSNYLAAFDLLAKDLQKLQSPLTVSPVTGPTETSECDAMAEFVPEPPNGPFNYGNLAMRVYAPGAKAPLFSTETNIIGYRAAQTTFNEFARQATPDSRIVRSLLAAKRKAAAPGAAPSMSEDADVDAPSYHEREHPSDVAIVVGIEDYDQLPRATNAARDADAVQRHLAALGVPERNIVTLKGSKATHSQMSAYLEDWLPKNVAEDSRVFFYFSGHGAPDPASGQAYLMPWDGDPRFLDRTAYPLKTLYASLGKLKVKQVLIVLDSCFSGAGGRSVIASGTRPLVTRTASVAPAAGLTVLTAAQADQITGSFDERGHGLFTFFFLEGLAKGNRDSRELYDFLKPRVQAEARRQNRDQTPALLGRDVRF